MKSLYDWVKRYGSPPDTSAGLAGYEQATLGTLRFDGLLTVATGGASNARHINKVGYLDEVSVTLRPVASNGSGPTNGFLEVSDLYVSSKAIQNFNSPRPTDFIFDLESRRFVMGRNEFGHDGILNASNMRPSDNVVGGFIWREDGVLVTDEFSGHYGMNWTPEIRSQYQSFMLNQGVAVAHRPWN